MCFDAPSFIDSRLAASLHCHYTVVWLWICGSSDGFSLSSTCVGVPSQYSARKKSFPAQTLLPPAPSEKLTRQYCLSSWRRVGGRGQQAACRWSMKMIPCATRSSVCLRVSLYTFNRRGHAFHKVREMLWQVCQGFSRGLDLWAWDVCDSSIDNTLSKQASISLIGLITEKRRRRLWYSEPFRCRTMLVGICWSRSHIWTQS